MLTENCLVGFKKLKNARGYTLTGRVLEVNRENATVEAYGLHGPGSDTTIHDVPIDDIFELPPACL